MEEVNLRGGEAKASSGASASVWAAAVHQL